MKKFMSLKKLLSLSVIAIMSFSLVSCGDSFEAEESSAEGEKTKIVLLLNGYLGDLAWYDCSAAGMTAIQEKYGDEVETRVIEMSTDKSKYNSIITDTLSEDWDVVVAGSWSMIEYIENAATDYPEKEFWFFDEPIEGYDNVYSMSYNANEGAYLAGMAAAMATETDTIGFIGGEDSTVVNDSLLGYLEGAKSINPDIEAIVSYTGNWDDSAKGKELALVQYNSGADVIFQLASNAGVGVFEAAKETDNLAIGSDTDQSLLFAESDPEKAKVILTSSLKRVDTSLVRAYELYKKGELPYGTCEKLGLDKECVGIVENEYLSGYLTEDEISKINKVKQNIIDGNLSVSTAYGMSSEEIQSFKDDFVK
ncbi:MAG: BMP family ABC transporter substrate-binding protein [Lachnospirales bacterium]